MPHVVALDHADRHLLLDLLRTSLFHHERLARAASEEGGAAPASGPTVPQLTFQFARREDGVLRRVIIVAPRVDDRLTGRERERASRRRLRGACARIVALAVVERRVMLHRGGSALESVRQ